MPCAPSLWGLAGIWQASWEILLLFPSDLLNPPGRMNHLQQRM